MEQPPSPFVKDRMKSEKAKSGVISSKPPLKELIFFSILLSPFLSVASWPFWSPFVLPEDSQLPIDAAVCCGIPGFFATWIIGYQYFRLWSKSEVSIDVERNEVAFRQSLIMTPGIFWRSMKRPLSELTNIEFGERSYRYELSPSDIGYQDSFDPEVNQRTTEEFFVKLHGYSTFQGEPWILEISEVVCLGWSKVPDFQLIEELAKLLGLPTPKHDEVFPDGEPGKGTIWPLFVILGVFFGIIMIGIMIENIVDFASDIISDITEAVKQFLQGIF